MNELSILSIKTFRESTTLKIIKIIKSCKGATEDEIKTFIYRNLSREMITGLEYDDPKTIARALKLFGIDPKSVSIDEKEEKTQGFIKSQPKDSA